MSKLLIIFGIFIFSGAIASAQGSCAKKFDVLAKRVQSTFYTSWFQNHEIGETILTLGMHPPREIVPTWLNPLIVDPKVSAVAGVAASITGSQRGTIVEAIKKLKTCPVGEYHYLKWVDVPGGARGYDQFILGYDLSCLNDQVNTILDVIKISKIECKN